jgi:2-oxoglutarate ferredoxin oxidoreductase subunit delta
MAMKGTIVADKEHCKGCGLCVANCPTKSIELAKEVNGRGYHFVTLVNPDTCIGCTNCATMCPDSVITVYRVKI